MSTILTKKYYIHVAISLLLMLGFGHLPPIGPLTPFGMKVLGIFLGTIYGWSTINMAWTTLAAMASVVITGVTSMSQWAPSSFAHEMVVFLFFVFIFISSITDTGIGDYFAAKLLSMKIVQGRPWVFTLMVLFASWVCAFFAPIACVFVIWGILYRVFDTFGFKKSDRYVYLMLLGVNFLSLMVGGNVKPWDIAPVISIGTLASVSGVRIGFEQWLAFSIPSSFILIIAYWLIMRFVFRIDLSRMKNINTDIVDQKDLILSKKQKLSLIFLMIFIISCLSTGMLPNLLPDLAISHFLSRVGIAGVCITITLVMLLVRVDGEPLADLKSAIKGVDWNTLLLFAFIFPFSNILSGENTGVVELITTFLMPLIDGKAPILFLLLTFLAGAVITNFFNNAVLMVIWITICIPICLSIGISPIVFAMMTTWFLQLAYMTPGASMPAALLFANTEWITMNKKLLIDIAIMMACLFVACFITIMPLVMIVF